jgi:adenylate cyclase
MERASAIAGADNPQRALLAFVRQEFAAPAATILGYAENLRATVGRDGPESMLGDLGRLHQAGRKLIAMVAGSPDPPPMAADFAEFRRTLRHDLRTPINAIKGYGEMLLEDAEAAAQDQLARDLKEMLAAAARLLAQIDALAEFGATASAALADIRPLLPATGSDTPSARILVVDDSEANRDLLLRRLEREGHRAIPAEDGTTALARVAAEAFDLVLLDMMMPGLSGYDVLIRLKSDAHTRDIPVIIISALDEIDSVVRCIEAGAEDYLPKPYDPVLLRARIGASLEKKRLRDREKAFIAELETEKERSEALLLNILPRSIIARLHHGETNIADRFQDVTILFSDIVGFTRLSARRTAGEVVEMLNAIFSAVDRLALEHGIEKIKTIGDAYMAVAGLPEPRADHAAVIARLALAMRGVVGEVSQRHGEDLKIRIGIHTGSTVAGVIGVHKFAYDIWGDTVNTASAMESHGLPDEIQVSRTSYLRLADKFVLEPRGAVEIKGKGPMETWLLRGERN